MQSEWQMECNSLRIKLEAAAHGINYALLSAFLLPASHTYLFTPLEKEVEKLSGEQ